MHATPRIATLYELFEHTADLGLRLEAAGLDELFADAGRGFFSMIVENLDDVRAERAVSFRIEGRRRDFLLFDWLNELLHTFDTRQLLLSSFDTQVTDDGLLATASGETLDHQRHRTLHEVKAITYHGLKVERADGGWAAEVIVDI